MPASFHLMPDLVYHNSQVIRMMCYSLLEEVGHWEDMATGSSASWTGAIRGSPMPPLCQEYTFYPLFPQPKLFWGCSLERVRHCWSHLDGIQKWILLSLLYTLWDFGRSGDLLIFCCPRQTSLSPCLLKLPPAGLGWSDCLSCMGLSFGFHLGSSWSCKPTFLLRRWGFLSACY